MLKLKKKNHNFHKCDKHKMMRETSNAHTLKVNDKTHFGLWLYHQNKTIITGIIDAPSLSRASNILPLNSLSLRLCHEIK